MDRRQMLVRAGGVTAVAAGVAVLAACGGSGDGDTPAETSGPDGSLAKVADIPVGGAISATAGGQKILLVQATAGVVTGLSAICTHQGCTVAPGNGELDCPCHGSRYDLTGAVLAGPAKEALTPFDVHVKGDAVFAGAA